MSDTSDRARAFVGQKVMLESHFSYPVVVEAVNRVGSRLALQVRADDGTIKETFLTAQDVFWPAITNRAYSSCRPETKTTSPISN